MYSNQDLRDLRSTLDAAGVFEHVSGRGWLRVLVLFSLIGACLVAAWALPLWTAVAWLPALVLAITTLAMLGHEGIHLSFSSSRFQNRAISYLTFPLLGGLGALYWRHKHNVLHHGHPNVLSVDPDIEIWPMVTSREEYLKCGRVRQWFQRNIQHYAFWFFTLFLPVVMRIPSVTFLIGEARRGRRGLEWWLDATCLAGHYGLWLGLGSYLVGFVPALLLYMATWSLVGVCLALIFAPAHIGLPIVDAKNKGWLHQLETTRNLKVPRAMQWFFVGLDYQVEHHLFPKIPHQHLPRAREIVHAWCVERGLPHRTIGYGAAVHSVFTTLRDAWKTPAISPEAMRAAWEGQHEQPAAPLEANDERMVEVPLLTQRVAGGAGR